MDPLLRGDDKESAEMAGSLREWQVERVCDDREREWDGRESAGMRRSSRRRMAEGACVGRQMEPHEL